MYLELINPQEADRQKLAAIMDEAKVFFVEEYVKTKDVQLAASKAGYELQYAEGILQNRPRWFVNAYRLLNRDTLLDLAEQGLEEILNLKFATDDGFNGNKVIDPAILKVKADMIKFATATLGKDSYSTRTEEHSTHINVNITEKLEELNKHANGTGQSVISQQVVEAFPSVQDSNGG